MMLDLLDILALAMVPAVLWLAWDVVTHYVPRFSRPVRDWHGEDYLIMGVVVSFGAAILNAIFWGLHFLATEMGWAHVEALTYKWGQFANIWTRWLPYVVAGLLHLAAAWVYRIRGVRPPSHYITRSVLLTLACFLALMWASK